MNLDDTLFEQLRQEAQKSPRLRSHHNLHNSYDDSVQRLLIAFRKGTYVRPHYHLQPNKWEMMLVLRGIVRVLLFDREGAVQRYCELSQQGSLTGLDIVPGTYHTIFPLTDEAIVMEVKEGPYTPAVREDFATWAPAEGDSGVARYLEWMEEAGVGDVYC